MRRAADLRVPTIAIIALGVAAGVLGARLAGRGVEVALSAGATWLTLVLLVVAIRNLLAVAGSSPRSALSPAVKLPLLPAGYLGLIAFLAGMVLGRRFWP